MQELCQPPDLWHGGEAANHVGHWHLEPSIVAGTLLFVALYLCGIGPLRRRYGRSPEIGPLRPGLFLLGTLIFFLALASPLDELADGYLFSAHMVQHVLLIAVVPPLWLLGTPDWLLRPLVRPPIILRLGRALTAPLPAFALFNLVFWLWHWPPLYELALANEWLHALQHLSFVSAAVLSWWPVLSPLRELPPLGKPLQLLYLFAGCQPGVVLGAIFVFSHDVLYRTYLEAPRLFAISALTDQQLAGLIMWISGNLAYLLVLSIIALRWLHSDG